MMMKLNIEAHHLLELHTTPHRHANLPAAEMGADPPALRRRIASLHLDWALRAAERMRCHEPSAIQYDYATSNRSNTVKSECQSDQGCLAPAFSQSAAFWMVELLVDRHIIVD